MSYIYFWVHYFAEQAPKPPKYQFTKFGRRTERNPKEGAKLILKLFFPRKQFFRKKQRTLWKEQKEPKCLTFDLSALVARAGQKILLHISLPICWADYKNPREGAKTILKLLFLSRRRALIKNERALSNTQKRCENNLYLILGVVVGRARTKGC